MLQIAFIFNSIRIVKDEAEHNNRKTYDDQCSLMIITFSEVL